MNLEDKKRWFLDVYGSRIAWISTSEEQHFKDDVQELIDLAQEEQIQQDDNSIADILDECKIKLKNELRTRH